MQLYTLINKTQNETFSFYAPNVKRFYKMIDSERRWHRRYLYAQNEYVLLKVQDEKYRQAGTVIAEWKGGLDTPIGDAIIYLTDYIRLTHFEKCKTVRDALQLIKKPRFWHKNPKIICERIVKALEPYMSLV